MNGHLRGIIIGAGHLADIQLEAWASVRGGAIVGILSRGLDKARQLGNKYGIPAFDSWDRIIDEMQPDFVDVCTPPDSHLAYTRLCANRGIPILCQKPLAPTLEESEELVGYCRERQVPLMINENWRWQGWYREIKRMIDKGMLGSVYTAYFAMRPGDGWGDAPYPVQPYFQHMNPFLIYETGVHWIDTYRFLFGDIESVYCQTRKVNSVIAGEDLAIIHFNFKSGATAIYDANRTTYMEKVRTPAYGLMTLEGTDGKLRLDEEGRLFFTPRGGKEEEHEYDIPSGWKGGCAIAAHQHFIDGLSFQRPFETSGEQYLQSVRTVFACYESARDNKVMHL